MIFVFDASEEMIFINMFFDLAAFASDDVRERPQKLLFGHFYKQQNRLMETYGSILRTARSAVLRKLKTCICKALVHVSSDTSPASQDLKNTFISH